MAGTMVRPFTSRSDDLAWRTHCCADCGSAHATTTGPWQRVGRRDQGGKHTSCQQGFPMRRRFVAGRPVSGCTGGRIAPRPPLGCWPCHLCTAAPSTVAGSPGCVLRFDADSRPAVQSLDLDCPRPLNVRPGPRCCLIPAGVGDHRDIRPGRSADEGGHNLRMARVQPEHLDPDPPEQHATGPREQHTSEPRNGRKGPPDEGKTQPKPGKEIPAPPVANPQRPKL